MSDESNGVGRKARADNCKNPYPAGGDIRASGVFAKSLRKARWRKGGKNIAAQGGEGFADEQAKGNR